jgi:predicted  nucleic acid-binding Zn-ribbon protein
MSYFKNLSEEQSRLNLKSEKVELGLFDDLKKQISKLEKVLDEAKSQGKQGEKLRKEIVGLVKRLDKLANENKSTRKDGTSLARQMGLTREKILKDAKQLGFESQIRNSQYIDLEEAESGALRSVNDARNDLEKMEGKYKNLLKEIGSMEKKLDKAMNDLGVGRGTFGLDDDLRKAKDGAEQRIKFLSKAISQLNNIY